MTIGVHACSYGCYNARKPQHLQYFIGLSKVRSGSDYTMLV